MTDSPRSDRPTGTFTVKRGLAEMLRGGVIMDVVDAEQAKVAENAGAEHLGESALHGEGAGRAVGAGGVGHFIILPAATGKPCGDGSRGAATTPPRASDRPEGRSLARHSWHRRGELPRPCA